MSVEVRLGIAGACGRGASFKVACDAHPGIAIHAVCDTNESGLDAAKERLGAKEAYSDYDRMLEHSDIDAVIIGTPMQFHAEQAISALRRGKHVLSEVTAGVDVDECKALVQAVRESDAIYMMAENYAYMVPNVVIREMVEAGLFGTPYYAEGEYLHELKALNEQTVWRRRWQTGINGITYGTHSLGPILQWMPGDRVAEVSCRGTGHHYVDPRGDEYENEDSCVMLCKMVSGALVKIRVDMLSDRPHAMTNYQLQGNGGAYESARAHGEHDRIWLSSRSDGSDSWGDLSDLYDEFLPDYWRDGLDNAKKTGHGGGDYFVVLDFVDTISGRRPNPIGVHEAMDMCLPGLISQQSIENGGMWMDVPDSRNWHVEKSNE